MTGYYASHYLSKIIQAARSSLGATSAPDIIIPPSDTDIDEDYYIVKYTNPSSVQSTLTLIQSVPMNWLYQGKDIIDEFQLVYDKLYSTCHQFDDCRIAEQFSNTHFKMGAELKLFIQFITKRYLDNQWLALMGLLMIGCQVLVTPSQVKKELIHVTMIGRDLILGMSYILGGISSIHIDQKFKLAIMDILKYNIKDCFPLLKDTCNAFSKHDQDWELKHEYTQVVSMATQLLLQVDN